MLALFPLDEQQEPSRGVSCVVKMRSLLFFTMYFLPLKIPLSNADIVSIFVVMRFGGRA